MTALESMETGWPFLQGICAPEVITLAGLNPIPTGFDFGEHLTQALEPLRALNRYKMVHKLWGTVNGGLPGLHSGDMLVMCQS
jgi:hypothetical protein